MPFGPLAFMPGKLVHTNEVTVLLGDNWFAKCSAKQAREIIAHRMSCECVFLSLNWFLGVTFKTSRSTLLFVQQRAVLPHAR